MLHCPRCGWTCGRDGICPRCSPDEVDARDASEPRTEPVPEPSGEWTIIARFSNAAEAGYFANELHYLLGCEPRLDFRDDFDALHHHWRTGYVLSVPASLADRARAELQDLLNQEAPGSVLADPKLGVPAIGDGESQLVAGPAADASPIRWAPLFLTLAASSFVIWYGKKLNVQRRPAPPQQGALHINLLEALGDEPVPWVQQHGHIRRELMIDARGEGAILREDRDGDGIFERQLPVATQN